MPELTVNGEPRVLEAGTSITRLLELLQLPSAGVAVEVNRTMVPRRLHGSRILEPGDEVEIVTFVAGG